MILSQQPLLAVIDSAKIALTCLNGQVYMFLDFLSKITNPPVGPIIVLLVGAVFSSLYGIRAVRIFVHFYRDDYYTPGERRKKKKFWSWDFDQPPLIDIPPMSNNLKRARYTKSWFIHQIWLNFIGSFVGWIALAYLIFIRLEYILDGNTKFEDIAILSIALLGITGLLPNTLSKIVGLGK